MIDFIFTFFFTNVFEITALIIGTLVFLLFTIYWNEHFKSVTTHNYNQIQKIHKNQISRFGGLAIFCNLFFFAYIFDYPLYLPNFTDFIFCLILFIPICLVTFFEDIHFPLNPLYRFIAMTMSVSLLFLIFDFKLPTIDLPILGLILNIPIIKTIFFAFTLIALINGFNFIDGTNGLMTTTHLVIMISLLFISFMIGDYSTACLILFITIPYIIFLFLNYPLGFIFIGDIGAYFSGWIAGLICFSLFSQHEELTTWSIPLIFFYPLAEVVFSFFRKIYQGKSPFRPDADHLHLKLFFFLNIALKNRVKISNNLVMPFMTFFWLVPPVTAVITINNILLTISSIIIFSLIYCLYYRYIPQNNVKV